MVNLRTTEWFFAIEDIWKYALSFVDIPIEFSRTIDFCDIFVATDTCVELRFSNKSRDKAVLDSICKCNITMNDVPNSKYESRGRLWTHLELIIFEIDAIYSIKTVDEEISNHWNGSWIICRFWFSHIIVKQTSS